MRLKIKANSFFEHCYLEVTPTGVTYRKTAFTGGTRRFAFSQIDSILIDSAGVLSFQVRNEIFSLKTKPAKPKHQQVIDAFVRGANASHIQDLQESDMVDVQDAQG